MNLHIDEGKKIDMEQGKTKCRGVSQQKEEQQISVVYDEGENKRLEKNRKETWTTKK